MFNIKVENEVVDYAKKLLANHNFGKRGIADGNYSEQLTGLIGQITIQDIFNYPRINGTSGFDNGEDIKIGNKIIDIKTMGRTVEPKEFFVNNFIGLQISYTTNVFIFCSFNKLNNVLTICGWIKKSDYLNKANFYKKGTLRKRTDGSSFFTKADLYELENSKLNSPTTKQQLIQELNDLTI